MFLVVGSERIGAVQVVNRCKNGSRRSADKAEVLSVCIGIADDEVEGRIFKPFDYILSK